MMHATGAFEVTLNPLAMSEPTLGRRSIAKVLRGDLEATGAGEMLTAGGEVAGSAAYVAVERITGVLHGRRGSFALVHTGLMNRGAPQLTIAIVPDSGTGELAGIAGTFGVRIVDGQHFYDLDYTLPAL